MKLRKTYSARISGNANKVNYIESVMSQLTLLSKFVFDKGNLFGMTLITCIKFADRNFPT